MLELPERIVCAMLLPLPPANPESRGELDVAVHENEAPATWERMSTAGVCPLQRDWVGGWK